MYGRNFYANIEKFTLFHGLLDRLSYRSSSEKDILFIFISKSGNALATSSIFLPEVFKPRADKQFVKTLIDKSRRSSYFPSLDAYQINRNPKSQPKYFQVQIQ